MESQAARIAGNSAGRRRWHPFPSGLPRSCTGAERQHAGSGPPPQSSWTWPAGPCPARGHAPRWRTPNYHQPAHGVFALIRLENLGSQTPGSRNCRPDSARAQNVDYQSPGREARFFTTGIPRIPPMPVSCQPVPPEPPIWWSLDKPGCPVWVMTRPFTSVERSAPAAMPSKTARHASSASRGRRDHRRHPASPPWGNPQDRACPSPCSAPSRGNGLTGESGTPEGPNQNSTTHPRSVLLTRFGAGWVRPAPSPPMGDLLCSRSKVLPRTGTASFLMPGRSSHRPRVRIRRTLCCAARTGTGWPSCRPKHNHTSTLLRGMDQLDSCQPASTPAANPSPMRPAYHE